MAKIRLALALASLSFGCASVEMPDGETVRCFSACRITQGADGSYTVETEKSGLDWATVIGSILAAGAL